MVSFFRLPPRVFHATEIEDLDGVALARAAKKKIVRLQIAVDEATRVRLVEANRHVREHPNDALGRQHLLALQDVTKLLAVEKLHREKPRLGRWIALEIEDADDVLVRQ